MHLRLRLPSYLPMNIDAHTKSDSSCFALEDASSNASYTKPYRITPAQSVGESSIT